MRAMLDQLMGKVRVSVERQCVAMVAGMVAGMVAHCRRTSSGRHAARARTPRHIHRPPFAAASVQDRDLPLSERKGKDIHFDDPEVCKYALAGLCPWSLFSNTKSDLGPCEASVVAMHA